MYTVEYVWIIACMLTIVADVHSLSSGLCSLLLAFLFGVSIAQGHIIVKLD